MNINHPDQRLIHAYLYLAYVPVDSFAKFTANDASTNTLPSFEQIVRYALTLESIHRFPYERVDGTPAPLGNDQLNNSRSPLEQEHITYTNENNAGRNAA